MSAPAGLSSATEFGGSTTGRKALTGQQINEMTRAAHVALCDAGVAVGPSKVARMVRNFGKAVSRHGMTFHEFLSAEANLTQAQRRTIVGHPEWRRVIAYADPTGETAVNRVMNGARRG